VSAPARYFTWHEIEQPAPILAATMQAYLQQIACTLRPASVNNADQALRSFAEFLLTTSPGILTAAAVTRAHIEAYKPWLADRAGRDGPRVTVNTRAHRLGNLRTFFLRIEDWGWQDRPAHIPIMFGDLPRQDKPLPKALDDPSAAKFLRAAQAQPRQLVRVVCEVLIRTGLRVGELTALRADAVMRIGAGHWLHVPVGKLHDDRYIPLHHSSSPSSPTTAPRTSTPPTRCCYRERTASRWTATASPATSTSPPPPPASGTSTPTRCATPSPPRPSTEA